ncbi:MAG TPA: HIT family protein [Spirochaetota bacterium]|nr:HIT family protein [Spirochaetota bacterium]HPJ38396.1 HIT family protein [Spirochaetota bacterium]
MTDTDHLNTEDCIFCRRYRDHTYLTENDLAFAVEDKYPVTPHHILVLPKRHIAGFFDCTREEHNAILDLITVLKETLLIDDTSIDGFNIGVNSGLSAGQTIFHLHVHLIPRRTGDMEHPAGGVRGVIPERMKY